MNSSNWKPPRSVYFETCLWFKIIKINEPCTYHGLQYVFKLLRYGPGICVKYFLSFSQKICRQRKIWRTKFLIFHFWVMKFTKTLYLSQFSLLSGFFEGTRQNILHIFRAMGFSHIKCKDLFPKLSPSTITCPPGFSNLATALWRYKVMWNSKTFYKIRKRKKYSKYYCSNRAHIGGYRPQYLSISQVIDHVICYKFECSHWWKIYFSKKSFTRYALQSE